VPKTAGRELTDDLYRRLSGQFIGEHKNKVILIHTVDESGWAHPAILSYFEVAAKDRRNIRLATYKTSRTTQNIRRTGKVTLSIFDERVVYYIKGTAEVVGEMQSATHNAKVNVVVEEVLIDNADPVLEPDAYVTSGITFANPNPNAAAVLDELLLDAD
jgi:pyridoxamine 5'-phosphate oxidase-like protein